jgi:hypothetical protein
METGACQNSERFVAPKKKKKRKKEEEEEDDRKKQKFNKQTYFAGE